MAFITFLLIDGIAITGFLLVLAIACKLASDYTGRDITIGIEPEQVFKYFALFGFLFYLIRSMT